MSDQQSNYGTLPMSLGGLLYKDLSIMSSYDMQIQKLWLEYLKDLAQEQSKIVTNFLNISYNAADEAKNALDEAAMGSLASGIVGLLGVLGSAFAYYKTSDSATEGLFKKAQTFQEKLNSNSSSSLEVKEAAEVDEATTKQIEGWVNGKSQFQQDLSQSTDLDVAINQLKTTRSSDFNAVRKNLSDYISDLQKRLEAGSTKFSTLNQTIYMGSQGASGIAQGTFQIYQAQEQNLSDKDQARAKVVDQVVTQWNTSETNAQQKADQFSQDAWSVAAAFGQITQTRA